MLNTQYIILYKSPRDSIQIMVLGRQIFPGNTKYFMECYQDATNQPFGFLLIDFKAKMPERFCLRSGLFSDHWVVYVQKIRKIRKLSDRLCKNLPLLKLLYKASPKQRRVILQWASDQRILVLYEIYLNVLQSTIPLNSTQFQRLKKRKEEIIYTASKKINVERKKTDD